MATSNTDDADGALFRLPMWMFEPVDLAEHFTARQTEWLCARDTFDEAILSTLRGLGLAARLRARNDARVIVAAPPDGNWFVHGLIIPLTWTTTPPQGWDDGDHTISPQPRQERREAILREAIASLNPMQDSPAQIVGRPLPDPASREVDPTLEPALGVWWDLRMLKGHTRESAQTLLALTVDRSVQTRLMFDETGPHLRD